MTLVHQIQIFLQNKFQENNLKGKAFARRSGIPYNTVFKITKLVQRNPELKTILKIANYFECSIDEVVGRNQYIPLTTKKFKFNDISINEISIYLRNFLQCKLKEHNLSPYKLASTIGYSDGPLYDFIKDNSLKKSLGILIIIAIADYFKISLDEMVGRINNIKDTESIKLHNQNLE